MTLKDFGSIRGVVFLIMAVSAVLGLFTGKLSGEQFYALTSMAFVAYFSRGRDKESSQ